MSRTTLSLLGLIALLLLGYLCIYISDNPGKIQADLLNRSDEALQEIGLKPELLAATDDASAEPVTPGHIRLVMDGRDATLSGWAVSQAVADQAAEAVNSVWGINSLSNNLQVGGEVDLDFLARLRSLINSDVFAKISGLSDADLDTFRKLSDVDLIAKLRATADGDMLDKLKNMSDVEFLKLFPFAVSTLTEGWKSNPNFDLIDKLKSLADIDLIDKLRELAAKELIRLKGLPDNDLLSGLKSLFSADFVSKLRSLFNSRLDIEAPELSTTGKEAQLAFNKALKGKRIQFETASADIRSLSHRIIDEIITILARYPEMNLEIGGHTDSSGDSNYNRQLSQDRAAAVKQFMINKGVAANRLAARGFGDTRPVASNASAAGRTQNRRVEFKVLEVN
ncbi:MAG: OmpA family protein [Calditrichota bacterium]